MRGLPTGGKVRSVEAGVWCNFGMWCDGEWAHVIQQQGQNYLSGTDRTDTRYRFNGDAGNRPASRADG